MKMKSESNFRIVKVVLMVLITVFFCFGMTPVVTAGTQVLKFGHGNPPGHPRDLGAHRFAELVAQKTNGEVKVEVYASAALGSDEQVFEQLQLGGTAFGAPGVGTISDLNPNLNVIELPFLFESWGQAWALLDGPIGQELIAPLPKKGIRVLSFWENGFRHVTNSKRSIEKPADLKGIKIRVPNWEMSIATFNTLPSSVTPMAWTELYMALQQGVVDAQENPLTNVWGPKFFEVQKYVSLTSHTYSPLPLIMSEMVWQKLPENHRQAISEAAKEAGAYQRQLVVDGENTLLFKLLEKGMIANNPDKAPFIKAVEPVYEKYRERFGDLLDKVRSANDAWKKAN